jgi:hypothetical protein
MESKIGARNSSVLSAIAPLRPVAATASLTSLAALVYCNLSVLQALPSNAIAAFLVLDVLLLPPEYRFSIFFADKTAGILVYL